MESSRDLLKQKLYNKIKEKKASTKNLQKIKDDYQKEAEELGISMAMLNKYKEAITAYRTTIIGNPIQILSDVTKYKEEYNNYVKIVIKESQENNLGIESMKKMLSNSYTNYMTCILGLPLLPSFIK